MYDSCGYPFNSLFFTCLDTESKTDSGLWLQGLIENMDRTIVQRMMTEGTPFDQSQVQLFHPSSRRQIANEVLVACIGAHIHLLHVGNVTFEVRTHAQVSIFLIHVRLMCQSYARFGSISPESSTEACQRKFSIKVLWQVCVLQFSGKECHTC